jgi:hypothetical protein
LVSSDFKEKIFRISDLANILHGFADLIIIQRIADISNILARIVDLACNLVGILDCDFIVELLADSNLAKTIVGTRILLQICVDRRICILLFTPSPPPYIGQPSGRHFRWDTKQ